MNESCFTKRLPQNVNASNCNLIKLVRCDQPCSEGYEASNLICNNLLKRNRGFLVERFIKPPVTLTLEFACDIDVRYIVIVCSVGAQKSSGIELFTQPSCSSDKQLESVASGVLKGNEKGFIFHRFFEDVKSEFGEGFIFRYFRSSGNLSRVKSLRIKIFRTQGSSVPALGKVDIFGVPYYYFPKRLGVGDSTNNDGRNEINHSKCTILGVEREQDVRPIQSSKSKIREILPIPDDFIDPITLDFMSQPVILPSGNVIDISTLEMFEKAETQWGRGLSDPFTGVPFTSSSKPVVAADLKARIDKFLSDNSNHPKLNIVPRTVGHGSFIPNKKLTQTPRISKLITNVEQNPSSSRLPLCCEVPLKKIKVEKNVNQDCQGQSQGSNNRKELSDEVNSIETIPNLEKEGTTFISFQEKMERSLESFLKTTLSGLPSFTSDEVCDEKTIAECNACKSNDNLFSIPCGHFICRKCLIGLNKGETLSCSLCGSGFISNDVKKVHIIK